MRRCRMRLTVLAVLAVAVLLGGCGSHTPARDIDPGQAADAILEQVTFRDSLMEATGDTAKAFYELDDKVSGYAIYVSGSGATAEEVAVLKVDDAADAAHAQQILEARVDALSTMFAGYRPDEMIKLGAPVIETRGNVAYLVLCDEPQQAKDAIESLYK